MLQNFLCEMFISGVFCSCRPCASRSGRGALAPGGCCRELAGMPRRHCELSGPPRAVSAASLPLKSSLSCRQPPRNPLSFCYVLAAVQSVPSGLQGGKQSVLSGLRGGKQCPVRIAVVSTGDLLQVLPVPSLPFRRYPAIRMPRWAEPRGGAPGCFPLPHSTHSTPENTAFFLPYSSAVGRLRISNTRLPWREGTAVGF